MVPEEIEAVLGLQASRTHRKGEQRSTRNKLVWRESAWLLNSPIDKGRSLPEHLQWLLDAIEPKIDVIRSLSAHCKIDVFCGCSSEGGQFGFTLSETMLRRLAGLGLAVGFDLYPPLPYESAGESTDLE